MPFGFYHCFFITDNSTNRNHNVKINCRGKAET